MKMKKFSVLILGLFSVFTFINAQVIVSSEAYLDAKDHMNNLQEGVLVVNLPTNNKKLKVLKGMVNRNPNDTRTRQKYDELVVETKVLQLAMIQAYQSNYSFSKVYFMPDTMGRELRSGTQDGIFVNNELELSSDIRLENDNYYLAFIGMPNTSTSTGKKSLLIEDNRGNLLASPFPYATSMYSIFDVIANNSDAKVISKVVLKQQQKLEAFVIWNKKQELKSKRIRAEAERDDAEN